jgi:hypothetical protein
MKMLIGRKKLTPTIATLSTVAFLFSTLFAPLAEASLLSPSAPLKTPTTPMHFSDLGQLSYVKQVQKGLKRKNAKKSATEAVTTESDVQVLEYDGFGRQVHTITTSQRNDRNKVWTQTDARVKSFDSAGRALDVERFTQSKATVEKKKGGLGMTMLSVLVLAVDPVIGAGLLASTSLGGQVINSTSHTVTQNQYRADGTLDEEASKAHTTTLAEESYQQGKNFGDQVMMATDIAVAVALVVATVMTAREAN